MAWINRFLFKVTPQSKSMRRIGQLPDEELSQRFCDFLETQAIESKCEQLAADEPAHHIWIRHEQDVERAKTLLAQYQGNPRDAQYDVSATAKQLRQQRDAENLARIQRLKQSQMKLRKGTSGLPRGARVLQGTGFERRGIPITITVLILAVVLGFATSFGRPRPADDGDGPSFEQKLFNTLTIVDFREYRPNPEVLGEGALVSIERGEVWRLVSPMLLHGNTMHLAFNMMNLFFLGGILERIHGSGYFLAMLLVCQVAAALTQILLPDWLEPPLAIGASGAVFGIFGFAWIRPLIDPNYPVEVPSFNVKLMLGFLVLCFTPLVQNIANGAHVGGLLAGMAIAALWPSQVQGQS